MGGGGRGCAARGRRRGQEGSGAGRGAGPGGEPGREGAGGEPPRAGGEAGEELAERGGAGPTLAASAVRTSSSADSARQARPSGEPGRRRPPHRGAIAATASGPAARAPRPAPARAPPPALPPGPRVTRRRAGPEASAPETVPGGRARGCAAPARPALGPGGPGARRGPWRAASAGKAPRRWHVFPGRRRRGAGAPSRHGDPRQPAGRAEPPLPGKRGAPSEGRGSRRDSGLTGRPCASRTPSPPFPSPPRFPTVWALPSRVRPPLARKGVKLAKDPKPVWLSG